MGRFYYLQQHACLCEKEKSFCNKRNNIYQINGNLSKINLYMTTKKGLKKMIIGIGIDLVEMERIRSLIQNQKFIERILSPAEREVYEKLSLARRQEFLAGRFAAKEAYAKALGTGIGAELSWKDITVINNEKGKPVLSDTKDRLNKVHISITHTKDYAAAYVVIEGLSG